MVKVTRAVADFINPEAILDDLWKSFDFPKDTYYNRALKHARILKLYYADFLAELTDLSESDITHCYDLYLSSYFLDDAFDSDHRPYALAIGLKLYVRFVEFVSKEYPEKRELLEQLFEIQMRYQTVEKDPDEEHGYSYEFIKDLDQYYVKQIILLFPLELVHDSSLKDNLLSITKNYFICILLGDDLADIYEDIQNNTKTPLTIQCKIWEVKEIISKFLEIYRKRCAQLLVDLESTGISSNVILNVFDRLNGVISIKYEEMLE